MDALLESQVYWRLMALAQRLPHIEQEQLFDWLCHLLNGPLSTSALNALTAEQIKAAPLAAQAGLTAADWDQLLALLHGDLPMHLDPRPLPVQPGEAPPLRVAFASSDGVNINGHFGSCPLFFIYQISAEGQTAQLIDIRLFGARQQDGAGSETNELRASGLEGCHLMFCEEIGGPAAARVIRHGIHPLKAKQEKQVAGQIRELRRLLSTQLPPWLARALGRQDDLARRFQVDMD